MPRRRGMSRWYDDDDRYDYYREREDDYDDRYDEYDMEEYYRARDDYEDYRDQQEQEQEQEQMGGEDGICTCAECAGRIEPAPATEIPDSTDEPDTQSVKSFIRWMLDMVSRSKMLPTKLTYIEQLFVYLMRTPTFMGNNERFRLTAIAKAQEFRADIKAQPIYTTLDNFLAKYSA